MTYLRIKPFFKGSLGLIQKEFFPVRNAIPFTSGITALYYPIVVISLTLRIVLFYWEFLVLQ